MEHDQLLDMMVSIIEFERAATREALATGAQGKNRFMLRNLTGDQMGAVVEFLISFKLNRLSPKG